MPPVNVSTHDSVSAAGNDGNEQVLVETVDAGRETDVSTDRGAMEFPSESAAGKVDDDSFDGWSEVKSQRKRNTTAPADCAENQKVVNLVERFCVR